VASCGVRATAQPSDHLKKQIQMLQKQRDNGGQNRAPSLLPARQSQRAASVAAAECAVSARGEEAGCSVLPGSCSTSAVSGEGREDG
jgi:hypothetical protein